MALQNNDGNENVSAEDDEIYDENVFSGWRKNNSLLSDLIGNPFVWGCAAALVLIVLLFALWPESDDKGAVEKIEALAQRIEMLENRVFILESNFENTSIKPVSEDRLAEDRTMKALEGRIEKLEAAISERTEKVNDTLQTITKKLSALEKRPVSSPPPKSASPGRTERPKAAPEKSAANYYTVQKGDTLYSIGRKYGISVEKLLEVNNIGKASPIVPGQKLRVTP